MYMYMCIFGFYLHAYMHMCTVIQLLYFADDSHSSEDVRIDVVPTGEGVLIIDEVKVSHA